MKPISLPRLSFDKLIYFFLKTPANHLSLHPDIGNGSLKVFKPENGLKVSIWDCHFFEGIELYNLVMPGEERHFFTLAYFLEPHNPIIFEKPDKPQKQIPRNSLFVSAALGFSLTLMPMTRYRCVSISVSRKWLLNVVQTNNALQHLKETIGQTGKPGVHHCMTPEERNMLEDLFLSAKQEHFRTFYVKAAALQLVSDFLYRLKEKQPFVSKNTVQGTPECVEQWIAGHLANEFPGTRTLAQQFSVSESTLKRHFRKKFGVTISAYATSQKMQFARSLIEEKGMSMAEVSRMVGYRSVQNFKEAYRKYFNGP